MKNDENLLEKLSSVEGRNFWNRYILTDENIIKIEFTSQSFSPEMYFILRPPSAPRIFFVPGFQPFHIRYRQTRTTFILCWNFVHLIWNAFHGRIITWEFLLEWLKQWIEMPSSTQIYTHVAVQKMFTFFTLPITYVMCFRAAAGSCYTYVYVKQRNRKRQIWSNWFEIHSYLPNKRTRDPNVA